MIRFAVPICVLEVLVCLTFSSTLVHGQPRPDATRASTRICDLLGGHTDRDTIGGGQNLTARLDGRIHFATYDLGPVFSLLRVEAQRRQAKLWWPDHLDVAIKAAPDQPNQSGPHAATGPTRPAKTAVPTVGLNESRRFLVTSDDVLATIFTLSNPTEHEATRLVELTGDCRGSRDIARALKPAQAAATRSTELLPDRGIIVLHDPTACCNHTPGGLYEAIAASRPPDRMTSEIPGTYRATWIVPVPAHGETKLTMTLGVSPDRDSAIGFAQLAAIMPDLVEQNRQNWEHFFTQEVPTFQCSNEKLAKLWYLRWYLLRLSKAGSPPSVPRPAGFASPHGQRGYDTFSTPLTACDLAWARDPSWAEDCLVTMTHDKSIGANLLGAHTAWQAYCLSNQRSLLKRVYEPLGRKTKWWIDHRDRDGDGLFTIEHPSETGRDVSPRTPGSPFANLMPREAVDASVYCCLDMQALAKMAEALGKSDDARRWVDLADRTRHAIRSKLWNDHDKFFYDQSEDNTRSARLKTPVGFYPFLGDIAGTEHTPIFQNLIEPKKLPLSNRALDAFARAAKHFAHQLKPKAAECIDANIGPLHTPGADPPPGCIDLIVRHIVGLTPRADGKLELNPLPPRCDWFTLRGVRCRGYIVDVTWRRPDVQAPADVATGYMLAVNGTVIAHANRATQLTWP